MTRSMGDATRSNLTWALEVMAKEYPNRSDYSVELGWNLMVTRQFDKAEEILQVKVWLKIPATGQTHRKRSSFQEASRRFPNLQNAKILLALCSKLMRRNGMETRVGEGEAEAALSGGERSDVNAELHCSLANAYRQTDKSGRKMLYTVHTI